MSTSVNAQICRKHGSELVNEGNQNDFLIYPRYLRGVRKLVSVDDFARKIFRSSASYEDYKALKAVSASVSSAGGRKNTIVAAADYELSDDERHFKRKPSRYEPSPRPRPRPPPPEEWEDRARHSKGSGNRERKHRYFARGEEYIQSQRINNLPANLLIISTITLEQVAHHK
ncbi:DWNN domain isoform 3 [Tripterygium wilfordii]|uniref:DWNN domain isoform 3 n=1 Tax=Tripterygium wilfordii TaxID=458696 RepID=A0A7J7CLM2_TRIWF|nr:DWNN domain isoform 3 [Tripterygium wilfordii]